MVSFPARIKRVNVPLELLTLEISHLKLSFEPLINLLFKLPIEPVLLSIAPWLIVLIVKADVLVLPDGASPPDKLDNNLTTSI